MSCQRCRSERILKVSGKCSDMCCTKFYTGEEKNGYVPSDLNIGGGDYIEVRICMECGQVQGEFPVGDRLVLVSLMEA